MADAPKITKISNFSSIIRILSKIQETRHEILIRSDGEALTLVKASIEAMDYQKTIVLSGMSERGLFFLRDKRDIQVEFSMFSAKVLFKSKILRLLPQKLEIAFPHEIFNMERRQASRFEGAKDYSLLFQFHHLPKLKEEWALAARPMYTPYIHWMDLFYVHDISLGGFCISTCFPDLCGMLNQSFQGKHRGNLFFPSVSPMPLDIQIRWMRRLPPPTPTYRIGCSFDTVPPELTTSIKRYVNDLQTRKAI
jgi:hypothetical protein